MKVRVSATVRRFLEGTAAYQTPNRETTLGDGEAVHLVRCIVDDPRWLSPSRIWARSAVFALRDSDVAILPDYAEAMEAANRDLAGPDDPDATGELNAARALLRQIRRGGVS